MVCYEFKRVFICKTATATAVAFEKAEAFLLQLNLFFSL